MQTSFEDEMSVKPTGKQKRGEKAMRRGGDRLVEASFRAHGTRLYETQRATRGILHKLTGAVCTTASRNKDAEIYTTSPSREKPNSFMFKSHSNHTCK